MRFLFLLPAGVLLFGILGFPLAATVAQSVGHYDEVLTDPLLPRVAWNTGAFAAASVSLELALGLAAALVLHHTLRFRGLVRALALLPWALPSAVMAMSWRWIFNDSYGIAGHLAGAVGLVDEPIAWLGRPGTAFAALVVADVWKTTPFVTIIVLAGLQTIPRELHEALSLDGAGALRRFWHLTLPLLRPAIAVALTFRVIQAIGIFDIVWVLTGGGPADSTRTVALHIYDTVFRYVRPEAGAALTLLVAVAMLLLGGAVHVLVGRRADA